MDAMKLFEMFRDELRSKVESARDYAYNAREDGDDVRVRQWQTVEMTLESVMEAVDVTMAEAAEMEKQESKT